VHPIFFTTGFLISLVLLGFALTSYFEKEKRAAAIALILATAYGCAWFLTGSLFPSVSLQITIAFWLLLIAGAGLLLQV